MDYLERIKILDNFKKDLKILINKYGFGKEEKDSYDGRDMYIGTDIYLTIDGEKCASQTLQEIIDECI